MNELLLRNFAEAKLTLDLFLKDQVNVSSLEGANQALINAYKTGGKAFSCGNGGSMCDAMHFAEELTGRFRKDRPPLAAMAISDPAHITCVTNDYGPDFIFSRVIDSWGSEGDVLLAISTSGNSKNIINAVQSAKLKNMKTIGLLGKGGGELKNLVDFPLLVHSNVSDRIQEIHIKIIHTFIESVERALYPSLYNL